MSRKAKSKWDIEDPTDADILAAIRYLDGDSGGEFKYGEVSPGVMAFIALIILLVGGLALFLLHSRIT